MLQWSEERDGPFYIFKSCANNTSFDDIVEVLRFIDEFAFSGNASRGRVWPEIDFYWDDHHIRSIKVLCICNEAAMAFKFRWL